LLKINKESEASISETKNFQVESVVIGDVTLRVVDTIGIGDTSVPFLEVSNKYILD
jgi:hypothetical protein